MQQHSWSSYTWLVSSKKDDGSQIFYLFLQSKLTLTLLAPAIAIATLVPILLPTPVLLVEVLVPALVPVALLRSTRSPSLGPTSKTTAWGTTTTATSTTSWTSATTTGTTRFCLFALNLPQSFSNITDELIQTASYRLLYSMQMSTTAPKNHSHLAELFPPLQQSTARKLIYNYGREKKSPSFSCLLTFALIPVNVYKYIGLCRENRIWQKRSFYMT